MNADLFPEPLLGNEVWHVAKSVAKWVWRKFTPDEFSAWQAAQGKKGGIASGESRRSGSLTEAAPWEAEGISRATWYRRKSGLIVPNHASSA